MQFRGRRVADGLMFDYAHTKLARPGDHGRCLVTKTRDGVKVEEWDWFVIVPAGGPILHLWVNEGDSQGNRHVVTEHEDGTITVGGSIMGGVVSNSSGIAGYHGHLRRGVWVD